MGISVIPRGSSWPTAGLPPNDIGDEPYQIYQKFGAEVRVAVCESRVEGIKQLS